MACDAGGTFNSDMGTSLIELNPFRFSSDYEFKLTDHSLAIRNGLGVDHEVC